MLVALVLDHVHFPPVLFAAQVARRVLYPFVRWVFWLVNIDPVIVQMVFRVEHFATCFTGQVKILMLFRMDF